MGRGAVGRRDDELHRAQTEIRHLRETIAALRAQLEEEHAGIDAAVQAAVAASRDEVEQLQATIQALRDQLQALLVSKDQAVQTVVAAGRDESRQLEATIAALRAKLEHARGH